MGVKHGQTPATVQLGFPAPASLLDASLQASSRLSSVTRPWRCTRRDSGTWLSPWNILEHLGYILDISWIYRGYQGQNSVQSISWHGKNGILKMEGIYMRQWRIILGIFLAIAFYGSIHLVGGILDPFQRPGIEFGILERSRFSGSRGHFSPGGGKGDWQHCLHISLYFFLFLLVHAGSISSAKDPNQPWCRPLASTG